MSEPTTEAKEPKVGDNFHTNEDEDLEIEEVCGTDPDNPKVFEVAAEGDFFDIYWDDSAGRWQEAEDEGDEENEEG